jgi:hypothetical protein
VNGATEMISIEQLRAELAAAGVTADSPATLDDDAERLAREERMS